MITLLLVVVNSWFTLTYGRCDADAANFHRNRYWTEVDPATGEKVRYWEVDYGRWANSGAGWLAGNVDMWAITVMFGLLTGSGFVWLRYGQADGGNPARH